jgi:hypothetical protein
MTTLRDAALRAALAQEQAEPVQECGDRTRRPLAGLAPFGKRARLG